MCGLLLPAEMDELSPLLVETLEAFCQLPDLLCIHRRQGARQEARQRLRVEMLRQLRTAKLEECLDESVVALNVHPGVEQLTHCRAIVLRLAVDVAVAPKCLLQGGDRQRGAVGVYQP